MARNQEREIQDAFSLIGYTGKSLDFLRENKEYLELVSLNPDKILTYQNIVLAFSLKKIKENILTKTTEIGDIKFGIKRLKSVLNKFTKSFNISGKKTVFLKVPIIRKTRDGKNYIAIFTILGSSNTLLARKSKSNKENIKKYFCIWISKIDKKCYFFNAPDWTIKYLSWLLENKFKIKFKMPEFKKYSSKDFQKFLTDSKIKIFDLSLNKTEIGISDKIIIKSRKGEGVLYYNKLKSSSILQDKGITIYDLDSVVFSYNNNKKIRLNLKRKKGYYIMLDISSKFKEKIPKYLSSKLNYRLFDDIEEKELIKYFIHRRYLDLYDINIPHIQNILEKLKTLGVIKVTPNYHSRCENPQCKFFFDKRSSFKMFCEGCSASPKKFISHYNLFIDTKKITILIGGGLKTKGYPKYKNMPAGYLGFKKSKILRVLDHAGNYNFILINDDGLSDKDVSNLRTNGIPIFIINLKGEVVSTLPDFNSLDSGELVSSLVKSDYSLLDDIIKRTEEKYPLLKKTSFDQAKTNLQKSSISDMTFERSVFSIFNFLFSECQKWGAGNLADGSFPIRKKNIQYLIWDAKRYDKTSLLNYIRSNFIKKDMRYLETFNDNKIIRRFGSVKYYLFVTSNTDKSTFLSIRKEAQNQIKRAKTKIKKVEVLCVNKDQLLMLASFVDINLNKIRMKYDDFLDIIRKGFVANEGYFNFDAISTSLKDLITTESVYPAVQDLRKE